MLRSQNSNCLKWQHLLVGLIFVIMQCDARAVNVSNTWTMPQEGLNVFYRFFRDRISWFEADAVCQFHHANLVTVDNSFQFDATRDLLRELDVNDIVWIGLMRPQSSDRFMWSSNSRPLVADTGYWAESLPLMDAPLCAVIDPIRDYRWHALRCGGPETASFLCEMPVPSWADACNLKDMPNLTLQYMADTASIELIRNCQEEGLLRTMCRGKQDRERAMQDLICPRERLEAQRINDITNSHFKSLQIINSIPSDNNENNDIELLPMEVNYGPHYPEELQTEKNTVQRLIEQFNVDELMQADEPSNMETVSSFYKIPGLIPKPVKKSGKKILDYNKKSNAKEKSVLEDMQKVKKPLNMDDMMMGDQPLQGEPELTEQLLNEEVSNEILEPLPHIKKTNIHKEDMDMEKMEKEAIALKKNMQKIKEMENKKIFAIMSTTSSSTTATTTTTTQEITTTEESKTTISHQKTSTATTKPSSVNIEKTSVSIGHPIHPQQQQQQQLQQQSSLHNQQLFNEEQHQQQHNKEAADNSHFIPPMLLVKSHYVPPANKHGHNEHEHEREHEHHIHSHHLDTTSEQQQHAIRNQIATDLKETTTGTSTTTTVSNLDLEKTTLKTEDTPSVSLETDSSLKAITQQPTTEEEPHKNLENLFFKDMQTTITPTISHPVSYTNNAEDSQKPATVAFAEITSIKDETHKSEEEIPEFKLPQTTNTNAETSATTKLLTTTADKATEKSTENFFALETTEPATKMASKENEEKSMVETTIKTEAASPTPTGIMATESTNIQPGKDNKLGLMTETKEQENGAAKAEIEIEKEDKKETITKITESLGISMSAATTAETLGIESKKLDNIEVKEGEEKGQEEIKSTITTLMVKTTTKPISTNTTPITIPTASISLTTTTTVKPITTTTATQTTTGTVTMPQNEVKSTETSVSSTSTTTTTTTTTNTNANNNNENNSSTNTPSTLPAIVQTTIAINTEDSSNSDSTSTSTRASTILKTFKTKTDIATETVLPATEKSAATQVSVEAVEITTPTPTPTQPPTPETTTRNFLKSTTDMPFKPNRRRSLTKPETVSYMKKILG